MRVKVRTVKPPADDAGLEELVAEAAGPDPGKTVEPGGGPPAPAAARAAPAAAGAAAGAPFHLVTHERPLAAGDLGPNGDVVLDLLARAAGITPAERKALEKEAAWRWWMVTPLPGTTVSAARARALTIGRADGRADAIVALEAAVAHIAHEVCGPKAGRSRVPACISNAGLAVLVRDLVEPETFESLFGPWREVMHH